jgi:hypothetical protein
MRDSQRAIAMATGHNICTPLNLLYEIMSKFLNTSEFIIMINSRHILNLS